LEVVHAFSDEYSRKIILAVIAKSLSVEDISRDQGIPISTCYRRVHELAEFGIIRPEKTVLQEDGKKYICYKSAFRSASIHLESGQLTVDLIPNRDATEKLTDIWGNVRSSASMNKEAPKPDDPSWMLADCDLCRARGVPCLMMNTGESKTTIFVCANCEGRVRQKLAQTIPQF
jgi:DNA-binding Lrp family transcriptional regulator